MGAGISAERQYRIEYTRLKKIASELNAAGIGCNYVRRQVVSRFEGDFSRMRFEIAYVRMNASNGECCLYPLIRIFNAKEDSTEHYGFGEYDKGMARIRELFSPQADIIVRNCHHSTHHSER